MYSVNQGSATCQSPQNVNVSSFSGSGVAFSVSGCREADSQCGCAGSPCVSSDRREQALPPQRLRAVSHDEDDQDPAAGGDQSSRRGTPKEWSNVELRDRLTELMEMHGESVGGSRKTDLRQWMTELNKCSRKKELLRNFCEERLKITLDGNETIPVLQKKATKVIYEVSVANAMDPVGFGKWSTLSYGQLRREQPSYANWVQETLLEGGNTCDYRLSRLGNWLMNQPDEEIEEANTETKMATTATKSTTIANYPMSKAKGKSGKGRGKPTLEAAYDARSSAPAARAPPRSHASATTS